MNMNQKNMKHINMKSIKLKELRALILPISIKTETLLKVSSRYGIQLGTKSDQNFQGVF